MPRKLELFAFDLYRQLAGTDGDAQFGVHFTYEDLYYSVVFLAAIYVSGVVASKFLKMPNLVGEIICGILLGPSLADIVPNAESWVLLGELGLVLLVVEAGIDIDLSTLKLIGSRGFLIAFLGSILPIALGMLLTYILNVTDTTGVIAAGACFGPTSLGIALNILRTGGVLNTPVGQLIVSAAVIDDMIALVILSQLEALTGEITVSGVIIPVVSALLFLILGGYCAIFILPSAISKYILVHFGPQDHDRIELGVLISMILVLMPATYYAQASYLMGAFVAGLTFCSSHGLHACFVSQFKRLLQWLMRVFFAASIGFQVPLQDFAKWKVIWQGLVLVFALIGKIAVGFMVPNFTQSPNYTNFHLRDCLITGFSMAAEGEFAFVLAVFAIEQGLISKDLYASIVLAVLLSTIVPPFLLRGTITYYNKKGEEAVQNAAKEAKRSMQKLDATGSTDDEVLVEGIKNRTCVFLCIQTQSEAKWGLLINLMRIMAEKKLDIIDHRAWSPRGINTTLVNEVYARTALQTTESESSQETLDKMLDNITQAIQDVIDQPEAKVKVQRWFPGVVTEIIEEVNEKSNTNITQRLSNTNITQRLLTEASSALERKQLLQTNATKEKTLEEIMGVDAEKGQGSGPEVDATAEQSPESGVLTIEDLVKADEAKPRRRSRRVRQRMRSTPVVGGGLFGETIEAKSGRDVMQTSISDLKEQKQQDLNWLTKRSQGIPAEITVEGQAYKIRISTETLKDLEKGLSGNMVDSRGIEIAKVNISASDDAPVTEKLSGFVRNFPMSKISEEIIDFDASERTQSQI